MGVFKFFSNKDDSDAGGSAPTNPELADLGREYAIAKRHGDRKTANKILRTVGEKCTTDGDGASFRQGRDAYDEIPPAYKKPRRRRS
ncbi:hypothetical protein ACF1HU_35875 [Streptomyces olivaceus]|uniref:hypothetical protein n=1 Tax=Streptomyces olivaceus TaxID=47716 RepID=UPI0036FFE17E